MKRLMKFGDFFNESKKINESFDSEELERAENLLETDLLEQQFIKDIFGENFDYELDRDTTMTSTGLDYEAWVEIKNAPQEILDQITTENYDNFAKHFVEWAKKHELYDPEITTPDHNDENSIIFKVNAGPAEDQDEEE